MVASIQAHTTAHARCGTSFILVVVFISVLVFSMLGRPPLLLRLASRVLFLPVITGISYEWLKFSARHENSWWIKALLLPGLAMQKLTTREREIACDVASGKTNQEIATTRHIAERTVKSHLTHIFKKLGMKFPQNFIYSRQMGCNHTTTTGQGFQDDQRQPFVKGR